MPPYLVLKICMKIENIDLSSLATSDSISEMEDELMLEINDLKDDLIDAD